MKYIYVLMDKSSIFYVGKTKDIQRRKRRHIYDTKRGLNFKLHNKIRKLEYKFDIVVLEEVEDFDINEKERSWIKHFRDYGYNLCNLADGGEGGCTKESGKKAADTRKKNGYVHSDETKKKISESNKGKPKSDKHKESLSKAWKRTPEQLDEMAKKKAKTSKGKINIKIYEITDIEGNKYTTENGLTEFCRIHSLSRSAMNDVVHSKSLHTKGWHLSSVETEDVRNFINRKRSHSSETIELSESHKKYK